MLPVKMSVDIESEESEGGDDSVIGDQMGRLVSDKNR